MEGCGRGVLKDFGTSQASAPGADYGSICLSLAPTHAEAPSNNLGK